MARLLPGSTIGGQLIATEPMIDAKITSHYTGTIQSWANSTFVKPSDQTTFTGLNQTFKNIIVNGNGQSIGGASMSNGWIRVGSGLSIDENEIYFANGVGYIGVIGNHNLLFRNGTKALMTMTPDGKIGIGVTPSYTIDVSGTTRLSGAVTVDGHITATNQYNITANHFILPDPGFNEGIEWQGGNKWKIFESDNALGNTAGNLQITTATASGAAGKMFTFRTDGGFELKANGQGALHKVNTIYFDWDGTYGNQKFHSITSESSDDLWINSYGNITLNIDSNNNDSASTFRVARHSTDNANPLFDVTDTLVTSYNPMQVKNEIGIRGEMNPDNSIPFLYLGVRNNYANDANNPHIWSSSGDANGAALPNERGHLVIEGRNNTIRHIIVRTGGAERMRITGTGNVGIGTTTPAHKLDVSGDIALTGAIRNAAAIRLLNLSGSAQGINVGKLLVSNAYADESKVPANGAYIHGGVLLNNNLSFTAGEKTINFNTSKIRDNNQGALILSVSGTAKSIYLRPNGDTTVTNQLELSANALIYNGAVNLGSAIITGTTTISGVTTIHNRLKINGTSGRTDAPTIDLAIGDSDTGFKWNSDGNFSIMANNNAVAVISPTAINMGNRDINGIKILNGQFGMIARSTDEWLRLNDDGSHSSGTYFGSTIVRTDGEFQVGTSGASFKANSSGATIKNKIRMEWNDTEGSLDFVLV